MKQRKVLLLFSGGLDSILAAKILEKRGMKVTALTFVSYFFGAEQAKKSAKENDIKLITKDISRKHFEIVKNPCYGRGAGMNPCIDCHLLMLKEAKKIMKRGKFDILATGEVLGQRPMSQNIRAFELIEKEAGLQGKILRPLSEKILHSRVELSEGMQGISGRSRKEQMALAKKYKIKNYPSPAGGCILTDKEYSRKLGELIEKIKKIKKSDLDLLRIGRHFWIGKTLPAGRQARIILGRNHGENLKLKKMVEKEDTLIKPEDIPGPMALVRGKRNKEVLNFARGMLLKYTKKAGDNFQLKIVSGK
jgi:hypothetical protein